MTAIDAEWVASGATPAFVVSAVKTYKSANAYTWPEHLTPIAYRDNWILALAVHVDPLIARLGLKKDAHLFDRFESFHYKRAFRRGFGICSQNALGFADLLHRRYGFDARVVGLGGHVVTQVALPTGTMIADPSLGVTLPYALEQAEQSIESITPVYAAAGNVDYASMYDRAGNYVAAAPGGAAYASTATLKQELVRHFERISDGLKWLLPLAGIALVLAGYGRGERRSAIARRPA